VVVRVKGGGWMQARGNGFLVVFFKKEQKEGLLF
jgi:hypothetical protein